MTPELALVLLLFLLLMGLVGAVFTAIGIVRYWRKRP